MFPQRIATGGMPCHSTPCHVMWQFPVLLRQKRINPKDRNRRPGAEERVFPNPSWLQPPAWKCIGESWGAWDKPPFSSALSPWGRVGTISKSRMNREVGTSTMTAPQLQQICIGHPDIWTFSLHWNEIQNSRGRVFFPPYLAGGLPYRVMPDGPCIVHPLEIFFEKRRNHVSLEHSLSGFVCSLP